MTAPRSRARLKCSEKVFIPYRYLLFSSFYTTMTALQLSSSLSLILWFSCPVDALVLSRRDALCATASLILTPGADAFEATQNDLRQFAYSPEWRGTSLTLQSLELAASLSRWDMGRWPDPILRRPARPVPSSYYRTAILERAAGLLAKTAIQNKAVGLAAQQCAVDARMIYLERPHTMVVINPSIVERSPEVDLQVWREHCLVLPPTFAATVLRDAWVELEYHDLRGRLQSIRLTGEAARAAQHELDHDRGILTLDHIGFEEMENDTMRSIERPGHSERQSLAYSRAVQDRETLTSRRDMLA
jgi:peptide deformylase